ncbi:DUF2867 domain-containing protein [candidate division GN15 bacterium]|nr:DUF2867 domain-containing protein [candidate division GN15 bacterium]
MASVLVIGATGYVGGRLVPRLLQRGHTVRCLARDSRKLSGKAWADSVEAVVGDVLKPDTLSETFKDIDYVYYLVHSMGSGADFAEADRRAARNVVAAAERVGVQRIIYLGGLGKRESGQSAHLRSRHETGDTLREGSVPVTEFRAAVIVGSGSVSFEMIHHLVNRLPVMICPRWVYTRTQPIGIADVLRYLVTSIEVPESTGRTFDIGGPEVLTYGQMMKVTAEVLGLRRFLIPVPVLTPRLSSYWVNLVTPVQGHIARPLIEGLRHETICENDNALKVFDIRPIAFPEAVRRAVARVRDHRVETFWTDASSVETAPVDPSHLRLDERSMEVAASADEVFSVITTIGGDNGWYYGDWLWQIRGFIDQQLGGVGLRRGRRHPSHLAVGDALDFWRVEEYVAGQKLLLRAEMRVWGQAWLEFAVEPIGDKRCRLTQTARYYPKGLFGLVYWYSIYPIHAMVFRGMIRAVARRAIEQQSSVVTAH